MHKQEKVFIGGSRSLSRLPREVLGRLDKIIERGLIVLVGDANGADKAVQRYLASRHYDRVIVYCMAGGCRNNVRDWPTREINRSSGTRRDASYYGIKDRAMGAEADYGFMLWDGKSRGTIANIEDLLRREKPVVAYLARNNSFVTLREANELEHLLRRPGFALHEQTSSVAGMRKPLLNHDVSLF